MGTMINKTPGETYRCLLVDDDAMDRKIVCRLLAETTVSVDVAIAETIVAARQMLISGAYDIVLIDHHLPDGFGGTFLAECAVSSLTRWGRAYLLTAIPEHANSLLAEQSSKVEILDKDELNLITMEHIVGLLSKKPVPAAP